MFVIAATLMGCGMGDGKANASTNDTASVIPTDLQQGRAMGGQNPISGARVYLYAAGNTAAPGTYGTGATSLLTSSVLTPVGGVVYGGQDTNGNYYTTTDSGGSFSITGDYACPAAVTSNGKSFNAEVYLLVVGGNPGSGENTLSVLTAALGPCAAGGDLSTSIPFVVVNEVSSIATVWALQQFVSAPNGLTGSFQIGAPSTNLIGLQNAFSMVTQLEDVASGSTSSTIGTSSPEADKINTLADILASCINSSGSSSICSQVFSSVTPPSSALSTSGIAASIFSAPADTLQAAWYMAQFPANIASGSCGTSGAAFSCISSSPPFPGLSSAPNDWTLAVGFAPKVGSTQVINAPFSVAVDGFGNAWFSNYGSGSVAALSPAGAAMFSPVTSYTVAANSGYAGSLASMGVTAASYTRTISHPRGLAVDSNGNVWLADSNGSSATSGETQITGTSFTCPTTSGETCYFGTVAKFPAATDIGTANPSGVVGYYTPGFPFAAAADASGNVYFTFSGGSTAYGSRSVGRLDGSGNYTAGAGIGSDPYSLAVDNDTTASGGPLLWIADGKSCTTTSGIIGSAGAVLQMATSSLTIPSGTGLTGANTGCTSSVHDVISASTGAITGIAVDASNNLWLVNSATLLANSGAGGGAVNTVTYAMPTASNGIVASGSAASVSTAIPDSGSSAGVGGLLNPQYVAVDGAGHAWVSNYSSPAVSAFTVTSPGTSSMAIQPLSGASGFQHAESGSALSSSEGIAIDPSGNVWVANSASGLYYVTVLVGAAVPASVTIPGKLGTTPSGSAPTITSFTASPATVSYGSSTSLSWSVDNATTVTLTDGEGNIITGSSPVTVTPSTSEVYTLTASNSGGTVTATATVVMEPVGTGIASTSSGMPRAQIFDYHITNPSVYDGKVYFLWGAQSASQPTPVIASSYLPYARDPDKTHTLSWYQTNHPDWVVYACDKSTPAYGYTYASGNDMSIDITNPAVRSWYYTTYVEPLVAAGYTMIAFDNIGLTNWDGRCGHYDGSGTWVPQFTGSTVDSAYAASVQSWVAYLAGRLHSEGIGVAGNITYPLGYNTLLPQARDLVRTVDLWLEEQGFTSHSDSEIADTDWANKFNFVRQVVSGRFYLPLNKTTDGTTMISPAPSTEPTATPASQKQVDWAVANYLLYRESRTLLSVMGVNDGGYFVDTPALDIDLGSPTGLPTQTVSGAWQRNYSGGSGHSAAIVLVNPSSTATDVVALPSGTWTDTHSNAYSGSVSLAPLSGLMLTQ